MEAASPKGRRPLSLATGSEPLFAQCGISRLNTRFPPPAFFGVSSARLEGKIEGFEAIPASNPEVDAVEEQFWRTATVFYLPVNP